MKIRIIRNRVIRDAIDARKGDVIEVNEEIGEQLVKANAAVVVNAKHGKPADAKA